MTRQPLFLTLMLVIILSTFASPALATVPAPDSEGGIPEIQRPWTPPAFRDPPPSLGPFNYVREFVQMTDFFATWQLADPDSSDYGGMIEAEAGYLGDVIQTDNTLEAIWCWSRYREFSGRDTYDENIAAAWIYCTRYPAWNEEGGVGQDYYRVHNCAWGLTAVLRYKAATGDDSFDAYAVTCADYIAAHPLDLFSGTIYDRYLNAFVQGWAAGNLYLYGEALGNTSYMSTAVQQGNTIRGWLDINPSTYMNAEYWAMSSGTAVWGVCNSTFRDGHPDTNWWLTMNYAYIPTWVDWYNVPGYDWDSSWNVAYLNAHFAIWDLMGEQYMWDNGKALTDNLLSLDTDDDGGIVAETQDPVTEDMSWVTCYLVKFGVDRLMGEPLAHDTGVLKFIEPLEGQVFDQGEIIPVRFIVTNYGLNDEYDVELSWSDTGMPGIMDPVDLPFGRQDTISMTSLPYALGNVDLSASTNLTGDENPANDEATVTVFINDLTAVAEDRFCGMEPEVTVNPFRTETGFNFSLATAADVTLDIFDIRGRRVTHLSGRQLPAGVNTLIWNGRDNEGRDVPAGLYLYRVNSGELTGSGKVLRLR
ncbi:MAG: hypothetical protein GY835_26060 [bacterium]|nr:hypothetical protein [bacterium]